MTSIPPGSWAASAASPRSTWSPARRFEPASVSTRVPGRMLPCGASEEDRMAEGFFHRDIELFIDHRVDWARYFRLRGADVNVADEVVTYKTILQTTGEICEDVQAGARGHWHEEVKLEN